jgi:hypothetical protein
MNPALKSLVEQHNFGRFDLAALNLEFLQKATHSGLWSKNIDAAKELYKIIHDDDSLIEEQHISEIEGVISETLQKIQNNSDRQRVLTEIRKNHILCQSLENFHCTVNARKIIDNEDWKHLNKQEKTELLDDLKDINRRVIIQKKIPELLNSIEWNAGKTAILQKLMSIAGIKLLELLDSMPQKSNIQKQLLRKSRVLLTQQMDALQKHLTDEERREAENNLLAECKTWLNDLLYILNESQPESLMEIADTMENEFITIWHKMEKLLAAKK